jgi:hypothetical protein
MEVERLIAYVYFALDQDFHLNCARKAVDYSFSFFYVITRTDHEVLLASSSVCV